MDEDNDNDGDNYNNYDEDYGNYYYGKLLPRLNNIMPLTFQGGL